MVAVKPAPDDFENEMYFDDAFQTMSDAAQAQRAMFAYSAYTAMSSGGRIFIGQSNSSGMPAHGSNG